MSCSCNCGCDNKYIGGVQCKPLKIKVSHVYYCDFTCYGWDNHHYGTEYAPQVGDPKSDNCTIFRTKETKTGYTRTLNVIAGVPSRPLSECGAEGIGEASKVVFSITPPKREWNGGYPPPNQKPPYTTWDSGNPELSVKVEARFGGSSDAAEYFYEPTSNPDPQSDFSIVYDQNCQIIVEVDSDGEVSVDIKRVRQ